MSEAENTSQYGFYSGYQDGNENLFTAIPDSLKAATQRSYYDPYFNMLQSNSENSLLNNLNKVNLTGSGQNANFAGSGNQQSFVDKLIGDYGTNIFKIESTIGDKMSKSQSMINNIISQNKQTALSLKQLEEGTTGGDDSTSFICGELKKNGMVNKKESMKMIKFLLKSAITHPLETYWYLTTGKFIIDEANKMKFNWKQDILKAMFITDIIKLEDNKQHNRACWHYMNNCLRLAESLGLSVQYSDSMHKHTLFNRIKGLFKIATHKDALRVGYSYLKTLYRNRKIAYGN